MELDLTGCFILTFGHSEKVKKHWVCDELEVVGYNLLIYRAKHSQIHDYHPELVI